MTSPGAGGRGDARSAALPAAAAIACIATVGIGLSLTIPLLSIRLEGMGVSKAAIGAQVTATAAVNLVTAPFVPRVAAALGVRRTILLALALGASLLLLFPVRETPAAWLALRLCLALSLNALFVLSEFWITAVAPGARRGLVLGVYGTALSLGFATGPAILSLAGPHGVLPFAIGASCFALAAVPVLAAGRDVPVVGPERGSPWALIRRSPVASLAGLVFGAVESSAMAFLALHGTRNGLSDAAAAALLTALGVGAAALQIPFGLAADRVDRRRLLFACAGLGAALAGALGLVGGAWAPAAVLTFAWGGVIAGLYTVGLAQLGARFTGADLAVANATFVTLYSLGMLAGPPLVGAAMDLAPASGFPLAVGALLAAHALFAALRMWGDRAPKS